MKRCIPIFLMIIILIFTSCRTTEEDVNISEEDAEKAFSLLIQQSGSQAMGYVFSESDETDFLGAEYNEINKDADKIPYMSTLLANWKEQTSSTVQLLIQNEKDSLTTLLENQTFPSALTMIDSSLTSASEVFESQNRTIIQAEIEQQLSDLIDPTIESEILELYDSYQKIEKLNGSKTYKKISSSDVSRMAVLVTDLYFEGMKIAEKNIRTTPDLYQDPLIIKVFSLI